MTTCLLGAGCLSSHKLKRGSRASNQRPVVKWTRTSAWIVRIMSNWCRRSPCRTQKWIANLECPQAIRLPTLKIHLSGGLNKSMRFQTPGERQTRILPICQIRRRQWFIPLPLQNLRSALVDSRSFISSKMTAPKPPTLKFEALWRWAWKREARYSKLSWVSRIRRAGGPRKWLSRVVKIVYTTTHRIKYWQPRETK